MASQVPPNYMVQQAVDNALNRIVSKIKSSPNIDEEVLLEQMSLLKWEVNVDLQAIEGVMRIEFRTKLFPVLRTDLTISPMIDVGSHDFKHLIAEQFGHMIEEKLEPVLLLLIAGKTNARRNQQKDAPTRRPA